MNLFSRRSFARLVGASAGAAVLPGMGEEALAQAARGESGRKFSQGFLWGSSTAAYQVEGAVTEEGRGPSIWDTFSHIPGKTNKGDTGDVADDHFHRYKENVQLMKDLGLTAYRFSVAWPRVFPKGTGAPNPQGLDFYNRMLDALLATGIQPFCTLYHWDLPQALQDRGGWQSADTSKAFADYAGYVAEKLSDRVKHFMTLNELRSFVYSGYRDGRHAPGLRLDVWQVAQVAHYAVLGHGLAVQAIRAKAKAGTKVGIADDPEAATPVIETPENIAAAKKAMREENAMFLTVIQEGRYTDLYLKRLGADAPKFTAEELKTISSKMDFVGINLYSGAFVRADGSEKGYEMVRAPRSYPHMASSWLKVCPEGLYWVPKIVAEIWKVKELYITENGCSSDDVLTPEGKVLDSDRVMYLQNYLTQLQRGVAEGIPVRGYFLWSLLDNYEWADGYDKRFGITYVDFKTQKRTPKMSSEFYKEVIRRNGLA